MRIQINKFLVVLLATIMLGAFGCTPPDPSQNNGVNNSNQNASNQKTSVNASPTPTLCSGGIDQAELIKQMDKLPDAIKKQFKEFTPPGNAISFRFDPKELSLTFMGSFKSDEKDLNDFIKVYDKVRSKSCVRKVYFQGEPETA